MYERRVRAVHAVSVRILEHISRRRLSLLFVERRSWRKLLSDHSLLPDEPLYLRGASVRPYADSVRSQSDYRSEKHSGLHADGTVLADTKRRFEKAMPAAACAITYGFGFYFMGYAVNFMWMDSIALLPLMLYGMERLDTRKGRAAYLFSLAAAIFMNFYMGAILCIFLALYEVVLVMRFKNRRWVLIIWFALCSLCAALLASLVLLPVIEGMLMDNVSRMSPPDFEFSMTGRISFPGFCRMRILSALPIIAGRSTCTWVRPA